MCLVQPDKVCNVLGDRLMYRAIEGSTCTSTFTKITIWGTGFQEDTDKKEVYKLMVVSLLNLGVMLKHVMSKLGYWLV